MSRGINLSSRMACRLYASVNVMCILLFLLALYTAERELLFLTFNFDNDSLRWLKHIVLPPCCHTASIGSTRTRLPNDFEMRSIEDFCLGLVSRVVVS
jgi:hypothetical protein